jgi:hypothetical protein
MKREACQACNETGWVHVEHPDHPLREFPTRNICLACEGLGYFELHEGTISLIERAPEWFRQRQWRQRRHDRANADTEGYIPPRPVEVA